MTRLEFERRKRDMTQRELGKKIGIYSSEISRIESGISKPFPAHAKRLSIFFGIQQDELLKEV